MEKGEKDKRMNLFMTKKLTWSSMRKGGAAVTNLFIWFHYKRKVNLIHFPTYVTKRVEKRRKKKKKRNRKRK